MKPLPIGIQTFKDIRNGNFLYLDKTKWIYELIKNTKGVYFLSRPRRFGKSLTLSTLKEIFEGNKEIFKGLWIYDTDYDWKSFPIIRVDFSAIKTFERKDLLSGIISYLDTTARNYGIELNNENYDQKFRELIEKLSKKGQVVILIDEYDKPIIDHLTNLELAKEMREILKGFYTIIKANDEYIRFVLLTGVSKFSKSGVFSGLNNLEDISMDRKFSSMLGITDKELKNNFQEYILDFSNTENISEDALFEKIQFWYNGYRFSSNEEKVYNPFSTLLLFKQKEFKNHWFETGTPTFLIEFLKQKMFSYPDLESVEVDAQHFSTYEIDNLESIPLLFQTGYLTIKDIFKDLDSYILGYPNFEVKNAFTKHLSMSIANIKDDNLINKLIRSLRAKDFEIFFETLKALFANIDYDLHIPQEKYYQTIFYLVFTLVGLKTFAEVKTNIGRIDVVLIDSEIYLFEFKLNDTATKALEQIKKNKYFEKYLSSEKKPILFGVEFKNKNIGEWIMEG
jgi:hypothetical protein